MPEPTPDLSEAAERVRATVERLDRFHRGHYDASDHVAILMDLEAPARALLAALAAPSAAPGEPTGEVERLRALLSKAMPPAGWRDGEMTADEWIAARAAALSSPGGRPDTIHIDRATYEAERAAKNARRVEANGGQPDPHPLVVLLRPIVDEEEATDCALAIMEAGMYAAPGGRYEQVEGERSLFWNYIGTWEGFLPQYDLLPVAMRAAIAHLHGQHDERTGFCPICDDEFLAAHPELAPCATCDGAGFIPRGVDDGDICEDCAGEGYLPARRLPAPTSTPPTKEGEAE